MEIHQRPYFIYELIDPRTQTIRYVGITMDPKYRYVQHHNTGSQANEAKCDWINELVEQGLAPIMNILETVMEGEAAARKQERHWIQTYVAQGIDLLNVQGMPVERHPVSKRQVVEEECEEPKDTTITLSKTVVVRLITPEEAAELSLPLDTLVSATLVSQRNSEGRLLTQTSPITQYGGKMVLEYAGWTPNTPQVICGDDLSSVKGIKF